MSLASDPLHQKTLAALVDRVTHFLDKNPIGKYLFAPVDINLPGFTSPVQPDFIFISNERLSIIRDQAVEGAPDLIVEVMSAHSVKLDRKTKYEIYAQASVPEYWLVDPRKRTIEIYVLRGQAYALLGNFGQNDQTRSEVLPGFSVTVKEICPTS